MPRPSLLKAACASALCACLAAAFATSRPTPAVAQTEPAYRPTVSDLMIAFIQPRHRNLWRARQVENWDYAAYEAGNLRGAFGRVGRAYPTQGDVPLQDLIAAVAVPPLDALIAAAGARDAPAFDTAFGELTEGCNSCHRATGHGQVTMRVPAAGSSEDQDFQPVPP